MEDEFKDLITPVVERAVVYLNEEFDAKVLKVNKVADSPLKRRLRRLTALISVNGRYSFLVSFSFDRRFVDTMFAKMTEGLGIDAQEADLYKREAAADMLNTIVGNCTNLFELPDQRVHLSPPLVLEGGRNVHGPVGAVHYGISLKTDIGLMDIDFFR